MVFSSIPFLYYFLPAVLAVYFLTPRKGKNAVLLLASLIFYGWGELRLLPLMVFTILLCYVCGLGIERSRKRKKRWLLASIVISVGLLGVFKYADFFIGSLNAVTGLKIPLLHLALPVGISFYTFQCLSYTIDVYRGSVPAQKNLINFGAYVALFPQLIAGPIVRYADIARELEHREHSWENAAVGLRRFLVGLGKKVILADNFALLIRLFRQSGEKSVLFYWMYAVAFTLNIYFDFSGYSDMAIGLGRVLGFHFVENFNYPYLSGSVTEFWRRWHISLGSWFRDYVYIPMGGSRVSRWRWVLNILTVWMLTGLWHGAAIRFVLWGAWHGAALAVHKWTVNRFPSFKKTGADMVPWRRVIGIIVTFHVVCFGWIMFRAQDMHSVTLITSQIFNHFNAALIPQVVSGYGTIFGLMAVGFLLHLLPEAAETWGKRVVTAAPVLAQAVIITVLIWGIMQIKSSEIQPFIYFQF